MSEYNGVPAVRREQPAQTTGELLREVYKGKSWTGEVEEDE